jgi:hypothetical protein
MDSITPWITFETSPGGSTVTQHEPCFVALDAIADGRTPSFVTLVGKRSKSTLLEQLLGNGAAIATHKDVYLRTSPKLTHNSTPMVVVDCGIASSQPQNPGAVVSPASSSTQWSLPITRDVTADFCSRILAPFASVICCFVTDLGGPRATARWLARQIHATPTHDLAATPRLLLVVETSSDAFDESIAVNKARDLLLAAIQGGSHEPGLDYINKHFSSIEVLGIHSHRSIAVRSRALKRRLQGMSEAAMSDRLAASAQFDLVHFKTLTRRALDHWCSQKSAPFRFSLASRPLGFTSTNFKHCLQDFLGQLPSQAWLWHFAAPLVASSLLLASFPPHAHGTSTPTQLTHLLTMHKNLHLIIFSMSSILQLVSQR